MKPKAFKLYSDNMDIVNELSNEEAGELLKAIVNYVNTGEEVQTSRAVKLVFIPIKQQIDRDFASYEEVCEKRASAGQKGAIAKASKSKQMLADVSKSKQMLADVSNCLQEEEKEEEEKEKEKSIAKAIPKKKAPKTAFADFVYMTNDEYSSLIARLGEADTKRAIEILDNYKGSSGKKYVSDYRAILSWVVDKLGEVKPKAKNKATEYEQHEYDEAFFEKRRLQAIASSLEEMEAFDG